MSTGRRINYYTDTKVRNKDTGEIGVVISESRGTEWYFTIYWSSSQVKEKMSSSDFHNKCEIIDHDFSNITDQIINLLKEPYLSRIPQIVARRLDPDYYTQGSIVYFQTPGFLDNSDLFMCGPSYPLIITRVVQHSRDEFYFTLVLARYYHDVYVNSGFNLNSLKETHSIDLNLTYFSDNDAYNNLVRYDKEY